MSAPLVRAAPIDLGLVILVGNHAGQHDRERRGLVRGEKAAGRRLNIFDIGLRDLLYLGGEVGRGRGYLRGTAINGERVADLDCAHIKKNQGWRDHGELDRRNTAAVAGNLPRPPCNKFQARYHLVRSLFEGLVAKGRSGNKQSIVGSADVAEADDLRQDGTYVEHIEGSYHHDVSAYAGLVVETGVDAAVRARRAGEIRGGTGKTRITAHVELEIGT